MAFLTSLADVARSAGLTVREVSGWKTRAIYTDDTIDPIKAVMWHHTATKASEVTSKNNPTLDYMVNGRGYPLCNLALAWDGSVDVVAAGAAGHAGTGSYNSIVDTDKGNWQTIGIEVEGTTGLTWSTAQLEAAARLGKALSKAYGTSIAHIGHLEYAPGRKIDPSGIPGGMSALRAAINRGYWKTPDKEAGDVPNNNNGPVGQPIASYRWTSNPHASAAAKSVAGMEIARNLTYNGNFQAGTDGWTTSSRVDTFDTVERGDKFPWLNSGTRVARFNMSGGIGYIYHGSGFRVTPKPGKWYAIKASIQFPAGDRGRLQLQFRNASGSSVLSASHLENNPPSEGMEYTVVAQAPEEAAELWAIIWPRDQTDDYVYAAGVATAVGDTEQDALNQVKEYFDGDSPSRYATAEEFLLRPEPTWETIPSVTTPSNAEPIVGYVRASRPDTVTTMYESNSASSKVIATFYNGAKVFALDKVTTSSYMRVAWGGKVGYIGASYTTKAEQREKLLPQAIPRSSISDGFTVWPAGPLNEELGYHTTDSHNAWAYFLDAYHDSEEFTVNMQRFLRDQGTYWWPYAVDGDFGYQSIWALQRFLADNDYLPDDPLWVDGDRGAGTIRAERVFLNDQRENFSHLI